jgi:hypothetical protein
MEILIRGCQGWMGLSTKISFFLAEDGVLMLGPLPFTLPLIEMPPTLVVTYPQRSRVDARLQNASA